MDKNYPLSINNVGDNTYMLLSKGHHDIHEFMKAVRKQGYDWPLGMPEHVWLKAVPNNANGGHSYFHCKQDTTGSFPATFVSEAYGEDQYPHMMMWTGDNLKDLTEFTGKALCFDEWFPTWEAFEKHVKCEGNTFKLIKPSGNEIAKVGDWIVCDQQGQMHVLTRNPKTS